MTFTTWMDDDCDRSQPVINLEKTPRPDFDVARAMAKPDADPVHDQSLRMRRYKAFIQHLRATGRMAS